MRKIILVCLLLIMWGCASLPWNPVPVPTPTPTPEPTPEPIDCKLAEQKVEEVCVAGEPWTEECKVAQGEWLASPCAFNPVPEPVCNPVIGLVTECWHRPPGEHWQWIPKAKPEPEPTPEPGCSFPQGVPEENFHFVVGATPTQGEIVNTAVRDVLHGSDVILGGPQKFHASVVELLRLRGVCAGQHKDGVSDEIAVKNARGEWEGYHTYSGDDSNTPETKGKPVQSPNSFRGAWLVSVAPTPPPPNTFGCETPLPPRDSWRIDSKLHTPKIVDTTCKVVNKPAYCASVGMSDRATCPVRLEGTPDRVACERYLANGEWVLQARNGAVCEAIEGNSAQFKPNGSNCRLCSPDFSVCTSWW